MPSFRTLCLDAANSFVQCITRRVVVSARSFSRFESFLSFWSCEEMPKRGGQGDVPAFSQWSLHSWRFDRGPKCRAFWREGGAMMGFHNWPTPFNLKQGKAKTGLPIRCLSFHLFDFQPLSSLSGPGFSLHPLFRVSCFMLLPSHLAQHRSWGYTDSNSIDDRKRFTSETSQGKEATD